jgi:hypothetical protein
MHRIPAPRERTGLPQLSCHFDDPESDTRATLENLCLLLPAMPGSAAATIRSDTTIISTSFPLIQRQARLVPEVLIWRLFLRVAPQGPTAEESDVAFASQLRTHLA